ncbi:MAG: replicative DNA helicase [Rubrobacter sp.]|nr:replicative DNA helicase [Rubrobacter sp.]
MERRGRIREVQSGPDAARVPPHDLEAERAVIGAMLISETAVSAVAERVEATDFYSETHRVIYVSMMKLYSRGEPIDQLTLTNELRSSGEFDRVGGRAYVFQIVESVPTAANAGRYADIVRGKALLRSVIDAGSRISEDAFREPEDVSEALDAAEQLIYGISNRSLRDHLSPVSELAPGALEMIQRLYEQEGEVTGVETGFEDLDKLTTGFHKSDLVVLAARPAMGKTAMALNAIWHAAGEKKAPVAIFSLEMSKEQLVQRLISQTTRIPTQSLRSGNVKAEDWPKLLHGVAEVSKAPIWIDDTAGVSLMEMRAKTRRLASQLNAAGGPPLALIVVDYLQLMIGNNRENRQQEIAEISRGLKVLARDLDVPVLAIAQLSRAVEARHDKRPMLSDLRDCLPGSALVTDADTGLRLRVEDIARRVCKPNVWSVGHDLKLHKRPVTEIWETGEKIIYEVRTRRGRVLRASGGHRVMLDTGWTRVEDLQPGDCVAAPRRLPEPTKAIPTEPDRALLLGWLLGDGWLGGSPALTVATREEADAAVLLGHKSFGLDPAIKPERPGKTPALKVIFTTGRLCGAGKNPLTSWLRDIGAWGHTGQDKHIPECVFGWSNETIAAVLRGLFHADGSCSVRGSRSCVRLSTISERLARDVQELLIRLGIRSSIHTLDHTVSGYRTKHGQGYVVYLGDRSEVGTFLDRVGFLGAKHERAVSSFVSEKRNDAGSLDRLPLSVNTRISELRTLEGLSHADVGWREQGKKMSRATASVVAEHLDIGWLEELAHSDLTWDEVTEITQCGMEKTYDLTVGDLHNFYVDGLITHNSGAIEQDADMVMFLYRDEYYNPDSDDKGIAEVIVGKHRNGPTGKVQLAWLEQYTKFASLARR